MIVRYENHAGETFTLHGDNLSFIDPMQLHTWAWEYQLTSNLSGLGGSAWDFARSPRTFELELRMRGFDRQQFLDQMNRLLAVADADNIAGQPGRLYAGEQYLVCYLAVAGGMPVHPRSGNFAVRSVTVLAVEPYWCTDSEFVFYPGSGSAEEPGDHGKKYNNRYAYRYGTGLAGNVITNTHYAAAPAVITVFGPATNPSAVIGGNTYAVNATLISTERLVIDQVRHEIYKVGGTGQRTSLFNSRDKTHDIFAPIQPGESAVVYSGDYAMTVTLIYQRSELLWTE